MPAFAADGVEKAYSRLILVVAMTTALISSPVME